jgi:hypothetical protein
LVFLNTLEQDVEITVQDSTGKSWTITVRAESLYRALFKYNYDVVCGPAGHQGYPRPTRSTVFDVRLKDGRHFRATYGAAMEWAKRKGNTKGHARITA